MGWVATFHWPAGKPNKHCPVFGQTDGTPSKHCVPIRVIYLFILAPRKAIYIGVFLFNLF